MNRTDSILVLFLFFVSGCTSSGRREEKLATVHRVAESQAGIVDLRPPTDAEVTQALQHAFGSAVVVDRSARPRFLAADFERDDSPDLAVGARPNGSSRKAVNN